MPDPALIVAVVLIAAAVVLAWWRPELGAMGLGLFLFVQSGIIRSPAMAPLIQDVVGRADEVILLALAVRVLVSGLLRRDLHLPLPLAGTAAFVAVGLISTLLNGVPVLAGGVGIYLAAKAGLWVLVAANLRIDERVLLRYLTVIGALFVAATLVAVAQFAGITMPWEPSLRRSGELAATSIWNQHTVFGSSMAVATGLAVVAFRLPGARVHAVVLLAASGLGIILSSVRRLLVSLPAGAVLTFLVLGPEARATARRLLFRRRVLVPLAVLAVVAVVILTPRMVRIAVDTYDEYVVHAADRDRYVLYRGAWELASESPLVGRGPATYGSYASVLFDSPAYGELGIALPDSRKMGAPYATLLGEYGFLGVAAFAAFVILIYRRLIPLARRPGEAVVAGALATGALFMVSSMLIESVVHQVFSDSFISYFVFGGVGATFALTRAPASARAPAVEIAGILGERRLLVRSLGSATSLVLAVIIAVGLLPSLIPEDPRPNIVVIMVDDLDAQLLDHLDEVVREAGAPSASITDLIGDQGATFANSFVVDPLCCPSRASFLRGQYPHNHGVWQNRAPSAYPAFEPLEASTLATWLEAAGYRAGLVGKYLNGYGNDELAPAGDPSRLVGMPPGWEKSSWRALYGTTSYVKFHVNTGGELVGRGAEPEDYQTDVLAQMAARVTTRRDPRPFFLLVTPFAPHNGQRQDTLGIERDGTQNMPLPAERHRELYAGEQVPRTAAFLEADVSDKPPWLQEAVAEIREDRDPAQLVARYDAMYRARMQTMAAVEEMVVTIIDSLGDELENTYIFFTSDNGWHIGTHSLRPDKRTPYETDVRVPLMVRGPGITPGLEIPDIVTNIDLTATILDLAEATPGVPLDGRSFAPLFLGQEAPWRTGVTLEYQALTERDRLPDWRSLRTDQYSYVEWGDGFVELYDLQADPEQLENIADASPAIVERLAAMLDELRECIGDSCFLVSP